MDNVVVFSIGSDGTDGPTDAAGGYSDGMTAAVLRNKGIDIFDVLKDNDAYNALKETDGLIITGPTGLMLMMWRCCLLGRMVTNGRYKAREH